MRLYFDLSDQQNKVKDSKLVAELNITSLEALYEMVSNSAVNDVKSFNVRSIFAAKKGNNGYAAELIGMCIVLEPGTAQYQQQLGRICVKMEWWEQAIKALRRSIYLNPYDADSWYGLGHVFKVVAKRTQAEFCFSQCLTLDPKSDKAIQALDGLN